jgi:hypothetical protein
MIQDGTCLKLKFPKKRALESTGYVERDIDENTLNFGLRRHRPMHLGNVVET